MDIDPNHLLTILGSALQAQVTQFGFAFSLAAWIHSGRVKKEIRSQFEGLTGAITSMGTALSKRIDTLADDHASLRQEVEEIKRGENGKDNSAGA